MIQNIAPGVFVETAHLGSNNAIVSTTDGVVLVDAPHRPTDAVAWRATAEEFGEVRYLIHTDHHIDHTMGNYYLPGLVVGQDRTREGLVNHFPEPGYIDDLIRIIDPEGVPLMAGHKPRLPDITFTDEMDLYVGTTRLRLISLSGHTPNTIGVLLPDEGIFFSGDNVCSASLPSFQEAYVDEWLRTLDRISELDFDVLVPGHGDITDKSFVATFKSQMQEVIGEVGAARSAGSSRQEAADSIRFEDNIHGATPDWSVGYPDDILELLQVRSIRQIYDQIEAGTLA